MLAESAPDLHPAPVDAAPAAETPIQPPLPEIVGTQSDVIDQTEVAPAAQSPTDTAAQQSLQLVMRVLGLTTIDYAKHTPSTPPTPPPPRSELTDYHELVSRLQRLTGTGVIFTGDTAHCLSLAHHDPLCTGARVCWEAALALRDYLRARRAGDWESGVHNDLTRPPDGYRAIPVGKHGRSESNVTMQRRGGQRMFPVPKTVAQSGRIEMTAHFEIGTNGTINPRMYYLDRWTRDGKVHIGYIGRHLENTKTN